LRQSVDGGFARAFKAKEGRSISGDGKAPHISGVGRLSEEKDMEDKGGEVVLKFQGTDRLLCCEQKGEMGRRSEKLILFS